ncbi:unnamed protein product [Prorocentrum cordatum]|uniref:Uncharacterized protein n=1 Tax=Prorocentrum cordatum TaxID=2364126 RepID=A0ABN9UHQ2_9DINO|nr:unnamed protein product [Polarella glacialis]
MGMAGALSQSGGTQLGVPAGAQGGRSKRAGLPAPQVKDAVHVLEDGVHVHLSNGSGEQYVPPLQRPGAIWDDTPRGSRSAPLAIEMYAYLTGTVGLVQVIPHGIMASWTSKEKVPMGGRQRKALVAASRVTFTVCVRSSLASWPAEAKRDWLCGRRLDTMAFRVMPSCWLEMLQSIDSGSGAAQSKEQELKGRLKH